MKKPNIFKTAFLVMALILAAFTINFAGVNIEPELVSKVFYTFVHWQENIFSSAGLTVAIAPFALKKLKLEKGMYTEAEKKGISFTEHLESLDPSENYEIKDAFQRQLIAHDLKTSGKNVNFVQDFFKTADSAVLFPEFINRNLLIGLNKSKIEATIDDVVSTTTSAESTVVKSVYADMDNTNVDYSRVAEGSAFPRVMMKTKTKDITLSKIGLKFEATYEATRLSKINILANIVQLMGFNLGRKIVTEAVMVLLNGDGNSNPAGSVSATTGGAIVFADLLNLEMAFTNFENEIIIGNRNTIKKILLIPEFRDPLIGAEFLTKGTFTTPFGNVIKMNPDLPDGKLLAFNRKAGVEMLELRSMSLVETDKLIDKQMELSVFSKTVGFSKIFSDSAYVLNF